MREPLWRGVAVALVTLFDDQQRIDPLATADHARRLVNLGIAGILVAGSTGEADALTDEERRTLVAAVRDACPGVPVLAGASGTWLEEAAARSRAMLAAGADALLIAPPRRCLDAAEFYQELAASVDPARLFAYHFPGVAGGEVPLDALDTAHLAGVKDSTGVPERLAAELAAWDGATYVGSAMLTSTAGAWGAAGAILAVANVAPELSVAAFAGDVQAQRALLPVHQAAKSRFPYGLKEAVAQRFATATASRA